jgi:hypothetical protein
MAADEIRIAWNIVTHRLCAVHPDDGTFKVTEVAFAPPSPGEVPDEIARRASAPGGPRLMLGPTLAEIRASFDEEP